MRVESGMSMPCIIMAHKFCYPEAEGVFSDLSFKAKYTNSLQGAWF